METQTHSPEFLRKRKLFVVLPLLALPFLTLLFWALGGGKVSDLQAQQQSNKGGLNTELPDAYLKDEKPLDKLIYYEKASSDSAKLQDLIKIDPYYTQHKTGNATGLLSFNDSSLLAKNNHGIPKESAIHNSSPNPSHFYTDPNEAKVYKKLDELNSALNQATASPDNAASIKNYNNNSSTISNKDIDRLEQMMDITNDGNGSEDKEMLQLNGMMDKILDIQHPERVNEKIKQTSKIHLGQVFSVTANANNPGTSLLVNDSTSKRQLTSYNRFFPLNDYKEDNTGQTISIKASIYETQTLVDGSIIKLRLLNDIYINGTKISKDNFVFGLASLNGERLNISVNSIRYKSSLFPVQLSVYDMDGMGAFTFQEPLHVMSQNNQLTAQYRKLA